MNDRWKNLHSFANGASDVSIDEETMDKKETIIHSYIYTYIHT